MSEPLPRASSTTFGSHHDSKIMYSGYDQIQYDYADSEAYSNPQSSFANSSEVIFTDFHPDDDALITRSQSKGKGNGNASDKAPQFCCPSWPLQTSQAPSSHTVRNPGKRRCQRQMALPGFANSLLLSRLQALPALTSCFQRPS